jgi:glycine betaine/proline transport system substrate-binding protein
LESAFGCSVSLVAGDMMPTFASISEKGQPDIAPEMWVNIRPLIDRAVAEDKLVIASKILSDGGVEGWFVPNYILQQERFARWLLPIISKH